MTETKTVNHKVLKYITIFIYSLALTRHVELFLKSSGKPRSNECLSRLERVAKLGARRAPPHYMETDAVVVRY